MFDHPDAAALTALGLHALQHRGQEACGIVAFDGKQFNSERRHGLVGDNFNNASVIQRLTGRMAVGHNRYSTTGGTALRNIQPLFADLDTGGFALAHNGNLTNALTLRRELISSGAICQSTSDTEVILHLLARSKKRRIVERFVEALRQIEGAYALVCLTNEMMIGARDPVGIRPLMLGRLGKSYVLASETCALDMVGAEFVREIENGEVVVITDAGIESHRRRRIDIGVEAADHTEVLQPAHPAVTGRRQRCRPASASALFDMRASACSAVRMRRSTSSMVDGPNILRRTRRDSRPRLLDSSAIPAF